jgi:hypothetical protein
VGRLTRREGFGGRTRNERERIRQQEIRDFPGGAPAGGSAGTLLAAARVTGPGTAQTIAASPTQTDVDWSFAQAEYGAATWWTGGDYLEIPFTGWCVIGGYLKLTTAYTGGAGAVAAFVTDTGGTPGVLDDFWDRAHFPADCLHLAMPPLQAYLEQGTRLGIALTDAPDGTHTLQSGRSRLHAAVWDVSSL